MRDLMRDSMSDWTTVAYLEVTSVSTDEQQLFSAVDALLEQVAQDDLPPLMNERGCARRPG